MATPPMIARLSGRPAFFALLNDPDLARQPLAPFTPLQGRRRCGEGFQGAAVGVRVDLPLDGFEAPILETDSDAMKAQASRSSAVRLSKSLIARARFAGALARP